MHCFLVQKKNFDDIHIPLRDDRGVVVPFNSGKVLVLLHFRKQKLSESMSSKVSYCCDAKAYEEHDVNQAGSGMPVFAGAQQQKVCMGGVLASISCTVMPRVKSGARAIGREALRSGMQFASGVLEGKNVKQAAVRRVKQAG